MSEDFKSKRGYTGTHLAARIESSNSPPRPCGSSSSEFRPLMCERIPSSRSAAHGTNPSFRLTAL